MRTPVSGVVRPLAEAPDPAFASGMLGPGFFVAPRDGLVRAPVAGEVTAIGAPHPHALCLRGETGLEVLVHVGVDAGGLAAAFEPLAAVGSRVRSGEPLLRADLAALRAARHDPAVLVALTNAADVGEARLVRRGLAWAGETVLEVVPRPSDE